MSRLKVLVLNITCAIMLCASPMLSAQTTAALPEWVVLVLKLVSTTHVQPVTGIVIDESGLVLIPAGFATETDEIVVLDGGTDIVRFGRPGDLVRTFDIEGFSVLKVRGLRRTPPALADSRPNNNDELRLLGFPPAEQIADGANPLNVATRIIIENGLAVTADDSDLPNVSGVLVDACGSVSGFQQAAGVPTLEPSAMARLRWVDGIARVVSDMGLAMPAKACDRRETPVNNAPAIAEPAAEPEAVPVDAVEDQSEPANAEPMETEDATESGTPPGEEADQEQPEADDAAAEEPIEPQPQTPESQTPEPVEEELLEEAPLLEDAGTDTGIDMTGETDARTPAERSLLQRLGPLLAAALVVSLLLLAWRWKKTSRKTGKAAPAQDERPTAVEPTTRPQGSPAPPVDDTGPDALLVIEGRLKDDTPFRHSLPVRQQSFVAIIGRGEVDIPIDSAALSRAHARLEGHRDGMTLTDLGSHNGTVINGIPCLQDETMYVQPGDDIVLADATMQFSLADQGTVQV